jgi:uncharacterized repeat protein (TIGR03803 family)
MRAPYRRVLSNLTSLLALVNLPSARAIWVAFLFCTAMTTASPTQTLSTVANFDGTNGDDPIAPVIQGTDGNFYGTTLQDVLTSAGTIYQMTPSGTLTTLYYFCSQPNCTDGNQSGAGLIQATDGNFYGTSWDGGPTEAGTVFKMTPGGTVTTLYTFCSLPNCSDGFDPTTALVQAADGNLYGTTQAGGANSAGTVFRITLNGTLTTLYSFCSLSNCADGNAPPGALIQGSDGNFYGTNRSGGANAAGTVFEITPSGTLTTLATFCSAANCADGRTPLAGLVQSVDGSFYGTTSGGGAYNNGTVFAVSQTGFDTVYSFQTSDASQPLGALLQASDGNFYGTTQSGGTHNDGTVFRITPDGVFTRLHSFCSQTNCIDGSEPKSGLIQAVDGNLYGTTSGGGSGGAGTVYRISGVSPVPNHFNPLTPCRLIDTRQTGTPIQAGTWQIFPVTGLGGCGTAVGSSAYSLNVTIIPHSTLGYLTVWPTGRPQPNVSTMNSPDGRIKANAVIVPAGFGGAVNVYATDTTDVILDINGYFFSPSNDTAQFYSVTPCRVVDTRSGSDEPQGLGPPRLQANQIRDLPILSSPCLQGINNPEAYSFNVTVVPNPAGQPLGYLTVWPSNQSQPTVSTLNNPTATVVANAAIVPAAPGGDIDVYAYNSTDLIIDINGYFAAPGQNGLSMYPVAPCRVLDTRNAGGPFMGEKTVNVVGSTCAPPGSAQAYVFNATVVPPGSMPYLTLWADGLTQPVVSTLNAYDGFITSNMAIVPTTNGSIDAWAQGLTQLILDISGYFAP